MANIKDITGQRFGRLVAIRWTGKWNARRNRLWLCKCDCGNDHIMTPALLLSGKVKSCGCNRWTGRENYRHGYAGRKQSPIYYTWNNMLARCNNVNHTDYKNYGGRGIKVCERWHDFANFLADVGDRPRPDLMIDRIDNDGDYEPGNVRWATRSEQMKNRRTHKHSAETRKRMSETHRRIRQRTLSQS